MADTGLTMKVSYDKKAIKSVDKFIAAFPKEVNLAVRKATDYGKRMIINFTPVKTGAARTSWTVRQLGPFSYSIESTIGAGAKYTPMLETGTGVFGPSGTPITPKTGEWLVFPIIEGNTIIRWVKTKSVQGQKANHMVERTRKPTITRLTRLLKVEIGKLWSKK